MLLGEGGAGYEAGWVAGAAGADFYGDGMACDAAGGFDDLLYGEALAVAEVADELSGLRPRWSNPGLRIETRASHLWAAITIETWRNTA